MLVIKKPYAKEIKPSSSFKMFVNEKKKHAYLVIFIMYVQNVLGKFVLQNSENSCILIGWLFIKLAIVVCTFRPVSRDHCIVCPSLIYGF